MNQVSEITDVEFKEIPKIGNPVEFLTNTLREVGYNDPEGWMQGLHPAAYTAETIGERLFLVNRSLALYLSEVRGKGDNIVPRMFISGSLNYEQWKQVIVDGVAAWLMEQFDLKTGKRIAPPTVFTPGDSQEAEDDSAIGLNLVSTEDADRTVQVIQPELTDLQKSLITRMINGGAASELDLSATLKVRGVFRGAASMVEFQDLNQGEDWHHMALTTWSTSTDTTIPVAWPDTVSEPKPFPPAVYKDGELVDSPTSTNSIEANQTVGLKGITEVIPGALSEILEDTKLSTTGDNDLEVDFLELTEDIKALIRMKLSEGGAFNIAMSGDVTVRNTLINNEWVLEACDNVKGGRWYRIYPDHVVAKSEVVLPQ